MMDIAQWLTAISTPVLPSAATMQWAMGLLWGVVLAWPTLAVALRVQPALAVRHRWTLVLVMVALAGWGGTASLSYWLGLSFQLPSLVWVALATYGMWLQLQPSPIQPGHQLGQSRSLWAVRGPQVTLLCAAGVLLGWLLMLDTLAFWPRSLYAWGFSSAAVAVLGTVVIVAGLLCRRQHKPLPWGVLAALLLVFTITRLPSGNVWDVVSDPLLWAALHIKLIRDRFKK